MIGLLQRWAELAPTECSFKEIDPIHNGYRLVVFSALSRRGDEPFPVINSASDLSLVQEGMLLVLVGRAIALRGWSFQAGRYSYTAAGSFEASISFVHGAFQKIIDRRSNSVAIALLTAYVAALETIAREVEA